MALVKAFCPAMRADLSDKELELSLQMFYDNGIIEHMRGVRMFYYYWQSCC